ncbi:MAG: bifunctional 4-hydroxy-2-oxoglutarate aldolase/2-dehydro-3-deoxy-phosphogluconate aldolase, partial [Pseudolysinimonas sp.]
GTVLNPESARRVVDMGAAFTVAPGIDAAVIDECRSLGSPHLPGVATGTEVQRALLLGLTWQKMFPARELGAGWVAAMRGPFPNVSFVATGGVDLENACSFLDAGVAAVSLGSSFAEAPPALVSSLAR